MEITTKIDAQYIKLSIIRIHSITKLTYISLSLLKNFLLI